MQIRGFNGLVGGRPRPRGVFMKVWSGVEGWERRRFVNLAVSITLPPPIARKAGGERGVAQSTAFWMLYVERG